MELQFPFLSIITLSPIVAAIIILMLPKERGENARMLALAAMIIGLILSAYVYFSYNAAIPVAGTQWAETLRFEEAHAWIPSIGINSAAGRRHPGGLARRPLVARRLVRKGGDLGGALGGELEGQQRRASVGHASLSPSRNSMA